MKVTILTNLTHIIAMRNFMNSIHVAETFIKTTTQQPQAEWQVCLLSIAEDHSSTKAGITKEFTPRFSKTLGLG